MKVDRGDFTVRPDKGTISVKLDHVLVRLPIGGAIPRAAHDVWALNAATSMTGCVFTVWFNDSAGPSRTSIQRSMPRIWA